MLTFHPKYGPRYPSRGRLGAEPTAIETSAQVIEALRQVICAKQASGMALNAANLIAVGMQFVEQAKANGMDTVTATMLAVQLTSFVYSVVKGEVVCTATAPPVTPPATTTTGTSPTTALAIGGGIIAAALAFAKR